MYCTFARGFMDWWRAAFKALGFCSIFQKNLRARHAARCTGVEQRGDSINRKSIDLQKHFLTLLFLDLVQPCELTNSSSLGELEDENLTALQRLCKKSSTVHSLLLPRLPQTCSHIKGQYTTYICSGINESSGTSDMVSHTGLVKGGHMVYSQSIHTVTLETQSDHRYEVKWCNDTWPLEQQ